MTPLPPFTVLANEQAPRMDLLALALAAELRDDVDAGATTRALDELAAELAAALAMAPPGPEGEVEACVELLAGRHGFMGDRRRYDDPANSMLDQVVARRRGLPILLSVLYAEVARRAGVPLAGVGLSGHFVVGHFGADPAILLDPFNGGVRLREAVPAPLVRPWRATEIAMRMLNNLVPAYEQRGHLGSAMRAAAMRLVLPADGDLREQLAREHRALRARMN